MQSLRKAKKQNMEVIYDQISVKLVLQTLIILQSQKGRKLEVFVFVFQDRVSGNDEKLGRNSKILEIWEKFQNIRNWKI